MLHKEMKKNKDFQLNATSFKSSGSRKDHGFVTPAPISLKLVVKIVILCQRSEIMVAYIKKKIFFFLYVGFYNSIKIMAKWYSSKVVYQSEGPKAKFWEGAYFISYTLFLQVMMNEKGRRLLA